MFLDNDRRRGQDHGHRLLKTINGKSLNDPGIGTMYDLEFLTDRRAIVVGNFGHRVIDLDDLNVVSRWNGHEGITFSLALPSTSGIVLSGASNRLIRMWDIERGIELRRFTADGQQIEGLRVTPDSRWLASRTFDSTLSWLWLVNHNWSNLTQRHT